MSTYLVVEAITEELGKLNAQQSTLSEQRTMLLDKRKEVAQKRWVGDNKGLAKESTHLRAANIEDIRKSRYVAECEVRTLCSKGIAHTCTVDI